MELTGTVALVTGGSGDLGAAICEALACAGAGIAVAYTGNEAGAQQVVASVEAQGRPAIVVQLDQADPASVEAAVQATVDQFGRLDILINNAAWNIGIPFPNLDALTTEVWDRIYDTNVRGPYLLARAAAPHLRKEGKGRVVNIASIAGLMPGGSSIAYASSKAALIHLTRCLAVALAPDVTVNCVAPGLIEGTRMAQRLPPEVVEMAHQRAVLRRSSDKGDIAGQTVTFCRSDSITGQTVVVDGGVHFH